MSEWRLKRFWTEVSVTEEAGGYGIALDNRPVRTPSKAPLALPTRAMAEAVAEEWRAQEGDVNPVAMPATRAANTAIDKVTVQFDEVAAHLADYGGTDLLCYRAEEPEALCRRQAEAWDPPLDWAAGALDARLIPVAGVMHRPQDPAALRRLHDRVRRFDRFALTGFSDLVGLSGSLILAFAVAEDHLDPETAWTLSRIDEDWQAEQWGVDEEAAELAAMKRKSFLDAARFLRLSRG